MTVKYTVHKMVTINQDDREKIHYLMRMLSEEFDIHYKTEEEYLLNLMRERYQIEVMRKAIIEKQLLEKPDEDDDPGKAH